MAILIYQNFKRKLYISTFQKLIYIALTQHTALVTTNSDSGVDDTSVNLLLEERALKQRFYYDNHLRSSFYVYLPDSSDVI